MLHESNVSPRDRLHMYKAYLITEHQEVRELGIEAQGSNDLNASVIQVRLHTLIRIMYIYGTPVRP